jgi:hypothetical protein
MSTRIKTIAAAVLFLATASTAFAATDQENYGGLVTNNAPILAQHYRGDADAYRAFAQAPRQWHQSSSAVIDDQAALNH